MQIRRCPRQRATLVRPAGMLCKVGDLSPTETAFRLQHGRNAATGCTAANVCSSGSNSQRGQPPSCQPLPGAECPISAHPGPKAVRQQTTRGGYQSSYRHTSPNVCFRATARRPGTTEMGAKQPVLPTQELWQLRLLWTLQAAVPLAVSTGHSVAWSECSRGWRARPA